MELTRKNKIRFLNAVFVVSAAAILAFLLRAPEETTSKLPHDDIHEQFHAIESKKEAEKSCSTCHAEDGEAPLPADHPPKFRCLFCHKREPVK